LDAICSVLFSSLLLVVVVLSMSLLTAIPTTNNTITVVIFATRFFKNGSLLLQNSVKGGNKSDATKSKIRHDKNDLLAKAPRAESPIKIEKIHFRIAITF